MIYVLLIQPHFHLDKAPIPECERERLPFTVCPWYIAVEESRDALRGCTNILRTCRQIHQECTPILNQIPLSLELCFGQEWYRQRSRDREGCYAHRWALGSVKSYTVPGSIGFYQHLALRLNIETVGPQIRFHQAKFTYDNQPHDFCMYSDIVRVLRDLKDAEGLRTLDIVVNSEWGIDLLMKEDWMTLTSPFAPLVNFRLGKTKISLQYRCAQGRPYNRDAMLGRVVGTRVAHWWKRVRTRAEQDHEEQSNGGKGTC